MTVGADMVGNHGQVWGSYVTPSSPVTPSATAGITGAAPSSYLVATTPGPPPPAAALRAVVAGTDLPRGTSTRCHRVQDLRLVLTQEKFRQQRFSDADALDLKVVGGELVAGDDLQLSSWLPSLPLATDVHTETATLTYAPESYCRGGGQGRDLKGPRALRLTLTRALKAGEGLALWFSSEVAANLSLPFLNFSHIRDGAYVCPKCNLRYAAPNPLKLHLATRCDTIPSHILWDRLSTAPSQPAAPPWYTPLLPSSSSSVNSFPVRLKSPQKSLRLSRPGQFQTRLSEVPRAHPHLGLTNTCHLIRPAAPSVRQSRIFRSPPPTSQNQLSGGSGSTSRPLAIRFQALPHPSSLLLSPGPSHGFSRPPATRPFASGLPSEALISPHLFLGSLLPCHAHQPGSAQTIMPVMPLTGGGGGGGGARPLLTTSAAPPTVDPCAEMETLVSNLGRSRRGHLCLYCGKIYSRKYGLKIHIRTHTGYKPLKCKVCLRPFGDPSNLNKHVRLHAEGETPYRCDHCGKVLVRRRDLDRHLRSRHPELPVLNTTHSLTDTDEEGDRDDEEVPDGDDDDGGNEEDDGEIVEVGDSGSGHLVSTTHDT
ncbi:LOW QUALITY PROTEIN: PR domain zinc finger protein 13-like [Macrobrachium nipponense]|uniref:LOW QUALITY PROTEIN: PR domain zinc finger protein 13-like n=1 Tax=Macrobrachium nipponense TaxID=159736 RepID=UPI0030C8A054